MDFDLLTGVFSSILQAISITYILSINLAVYFIIKFIDNHNGRKIVSAKLKKLVTLIVTSILFAIFYLIKLTNLEVLITSTLFVPLTYKYVMKFLLKTFGIAYKEEEL